VRLVPVERRTGQRPGRGSLKGKIWISDDFDKVDDEIIEEFEQAISEVCCEFPSRHTCHVVVVHR
jgi:hypothetical protein